MRLLYKSVALVGTSHIGSVRDILPSTIKSSPSGPRKIAILLKVIAGRNYEMSKQNPTREQIAEAVDTLGKWFPEEAPKLAKYREAIIDHVVRKSEPAADSALATMKYSETRPVLVELPTLTPCEEACIKVVVDVVFLVIGLVGLHASNEERITRAIIRELGGETLRGFSRAIHAFSDADGAMNKAKALFTLFGQIYNAGGFKAALKIIKDEMTWWDWVKTGLIAVAQITAWFATDGVAFVAEVALSIMSAEQLIEDAVKAVKDCNCNSPVTPEGPTIGDGAWFQTTAATHSSDVVYAVQKGDLYRTSPIDGHYTKLSSDWGDTKCMASNAGFLYIISKAYGRLALYSLDPIHDSAGRMLLQYLRGSTARCMVGVGARLYYVADSTLYIVSAYGGRDPTALTDVWSGATCMTKLGDFLYIAANSNLYRVDPDNGQPKESFGGFSDTPCMSPYNGKLYVVQKKDLYRVDGMTGSYVNISKPAGTWHDSTVMTTLADNLYIVQNGNMFRVDPSNGNYTKL